MVTTQSVSVMAMEKSAKYASWVIGVAKSGVLPKKPTRQTQSVRRRGIHTAKESLHLHPSKFTLVRIPKDQPRNINDALSVCKKLDFAISCANIVEQDSL